MMEQADWDALKEQMASPWGYMKLKCDGFEISLSQETDRTKKSWSTMVYVDGYLKGIWLDCDHKTGEPKHEETRRFYRKVTRALHTKRDIESYRKIYGKRKAIEMAAIKFYTYDWCWKSFSSLKNTCWPTTPASPASLRADVMDHSKALDKIKKLLRLAASDNPHEAAAAMRQARALMEKYRLEESDIQLSEVFECAARSGSKMTPPQWEANLVGALTQAYACKVLFMAGIGEWRFIGELAELASYTMALLLRQVRQSRRDFISAQLKRCKPATKTKRADVFCGAWVSAVRQQVMAFAGNDEPSPATAAYMLKHHSETEKLDCRDRNASKGHGVRAMTDAMHGALAAGDVRLNHGVNGQEQLALH